MNDFWKGYPQKEKKPESPEEEAQTEQFMEQLTSLKQANLVKEIGFLWKRSRE